MFSAYTHDSLKNVFEFKERLKVWPFETGLFVWLQFFGVNKLSWILWNAGTNKRISDWLRTFF